MAAEIAIFIITFILTLCVIGLYQKNTNAICESKKRLDGKTVLVTGGTAGMGIKIATDLAGRKAKVIVACPFNDEGAKAIKYITSKSESDNVIFKNLDLASFESVRKFAADILATEERLDILVNNAGVALVNERLTRDGLNFIMQVNYYGAFLLTVLLLPLLKKTGEKNEPSRIINTASLLHHFGCIDFEKMNKSAYYLFMLRSYSNSKICVLLFAKELTRRLKGSHVVINTVDPGAVGTRITQGGSNKNLGKIISFLFYILFKSPWEGCQTALHVALDKQAGEVSGEFFKNCKPIKATSRAYDDKTAKQLWEESVRLVKLSDNFEICKQVL